MTLTARKIVAKNWTSSDWVYPPVAGKNNWAGSFRTPSVDFPQYDFPRAEDGFYAEPQGNFADGTKIPTGDYRIFARTLRTYGDRTNINDWQWKLSAWFHIQRAPNATAAVPTAVPSATVSSLSASITSTASTTTASTTAASTTTASCSGSALPISLQATVNNKANTTYDLYLYSDFLAMQYSAGIVGSANTVLNDWYLVNGSVLQTSYGQSGQSGYKTVFAEAASTSDNSLIYMYAASRVGSSLEYLQVSIDDATGLVSIDSAGKNLVYVCTSNGVLRNGPVLVDGCTLVTLHAQQKCTNGTALPTPSAVSILST